MIQKFKAIFTEQELDKTLQEALKFFLPMDDKVNFDYICDQIRKSLLVIKKHEPEILTYQVGVVMDSVTQAGAFFIWVPKLRYFIPLSESANLLSKLYEEV